jgi:hypothetical protein
MLLSSAFCLLLLCSVPLSNVQLQLVFRVVSVPEAHFAPGALGVRGRLAARAEVLGLIHALGLDHATDSAAVRGHSVFVELENGGSVRKRTTVA